MSNTFPSLRAIAAVMDLQSVQRLYNVAKTPIPGETYDPKVINQSAITQFINRQLTKDRESAAPMIPYNTAEEVLAAAIDWDTENPATSTRRGSSAGSGTSTKDHSKRRFSQWELSEENPAPMVILRKDPYVYVVVYQTTSHTVARPVYPGVEGYNPNTLSCNPDVKFENMEALQEAFNSRRLYFLGESLKVISNSVLNLKGLGPSGYLGEATRRWSEHAWDKPKQSEAEPTPFDGNN